MEKIWRLLKKLKIELPCDPAIPRLRIYPKECESAYNKGTCTHMFIAALFTIVKLWKQPTCTTNAEWIKKMCLYIYSSLNKIVSFAGEWMELKNVISSEVASLTRPKASCSLSCVEYRPKTNAVIL
jgi:hypothetical protein